MGLFDFLKPKPREDCLKLYAATLFQLAAEAANATKRFAESGGEKVGDTAWFAVLMEYQNLYIQITDRALFGKLSEEKRGALMTDFAMTCIGNSVSAICKGWGPDRIAKVQAEGIANYRTSLKEFGQYRKLFPEDGEGTKGTLIWEFSKRMAELSGHENDIAWIMFFTEQVNFERLDVFNIVKKVVA